MNEPNAVFELLAAWRAGAYRAQKWLSALGVLGLAAAGALAAWRGRWALAAGAAGLMLLAAGVLWGLAWRRRVERRFWQDTRKPRRGGPVRLPLGP